MTDAAKIAGYETDLADTVAAALGRMRCAHKRGTGCTLTAEMIAALGVTFLAQIWGEIDEETDR